MDTLAVYEVSRHVQLLSKPLQTAGGVQHCEWLFRVVVKSNDQKSQSEVINSKKSRLEQGWGVCTKRKSSL